ncbi:hypothetical protein MUP77_16050 [Candidatus Bathyarchaeota archaeon]|nr:hypothetical protein [Candidatus Bathyarchaeota archaeon]
MRVLEEAKSKVDQYDRFDNERRKGKYNRAYRDLLRARVGQSSLVDENGSISDASISLVENTLIAFEMKKHGQMDDQFGDKLEQKLEDDETKFLLRNFRELTILSSDIESIKVDACFLFEKLAEAKDGLDARGYCFGVGAAKIMNFLCPELFVMMDSFVIQGLDMNGFRDFRNYWSIMTTCHKELRDWQRKFLGLDSLTCLDQKPTTLTRIFDKCAFVMGLEKRGIVRFRR